jgi:hypothetical protein
VVVVKCFELEILDEIKQQKFSKIPEKIALGLEICMHTFSMDALSK